MAVISEKNVSITSIKDPVLPETNLKRCNNTISTSVDDIKLLKKNSEKKMENLLDIQSKNDSLNSNFFFLFYNFFFKLINLR